MIMILPVTGDNRLTFPLTSMCKTKPNLSIISKPTNLIKLPLLLYQVAPHISVTHLLSAEYESVKHKKYGE